MSELPISHLLPYQSLRYYPARALINLFGNLDKHFEVALNFNYDFELVLKTTLKLHSWRL